MVNFHQRQVIFSSCSSRYKNPCSHITHETAKNAVIFHTHYNFLKNRGEMAMFLNFQLFQKNSVCILMDKQLALKQWRIPNIELDLNREAVRANQKAGYKNGRLPSCFFTHYFCTGVRAEQRVQLKM